MCVYPCCNKPSITENSPPVAGQKSPKTKRHYFFFPPFSQTVFVCLVLAGVSHTLGERGDPVSRYNAVYRTLGTLAWKLLINNASERRENDYCERARAGGKPDSDYYLNNYIEVHRLNKDVNN